MLPFRYLGTVRDLRPLRYMHSVPRLKSPAIGEAGEGDSHDAAEARKRKSKGIRRFGRAGDFVPLTFSLRDIAVLLARFDWFLLHLQPF